MSADGGATLAQSRKPDGERWEPRKRFRLKLRGAATTALCHSHANRRCYCLLRGTTPSMYWPLSRIQPRVTRIIMPVMAMMTTSATSQPTTTQKNCWGEEHDHSNATGDQSYASRTRKQTYEDAVPHPTGLVAIDYSDPDWDQEYQPENDN